jgi:hypothetical protein
MAVAVWFDLFGLGPSLRIRSGAISRSEMPQKRKCHNKGNDIGRNDIGKVSFERSAAVDCGRSLRERAPLPSEATEAISGSNNTPTGCSDAINSKVPASKEDKQNNHS